MTNTSIIPLPNSRFKLIKGSWWNKVKVVRQGESKEPWDEEWSENPAIPILRSTGAICVNDHFIPLWHKTRGIMFLAGGYGSSKTTYVITRLLVKCLENKYFRCYYGRQKKEEAKNLHSNILTEIRRNGWEDLFHYSTENNGSKRITCKENNNKFELFGCDDVASLKGLDNPTDILVDEINQIDFATFGMLFTRLRGSGYETQMIGCFNNCDVFPDHWIRKYIYVDGEAKADHASDSKEKTLVESLKKKRIERHHSDYTHNHFQNPAAYRASLEVQAGGDPLLIEAYCNGEWGVLLDKQPYYKMFNRQRDVSWPIVAGVSVQDDKQNINLPLHVSFDENVNPYLPCLIAQIDGKRVYIIDEIAAENPNNTLMWICAEVERRFGANRSGMFVYGDATSDKEDVKQEKGVDFFDLAMQHLTFFHPSRRVPDANPNNKMRGNFINSVFALKYGGIEIIISPKCKHLIEDLTNCPEAPDGRKAKDKSMINGKRGVQKYGHFGDCLDYLMCYAFADDYRSFQSGGKYHAPKVGYIPVRNSMEAKPLAVAGKKIVRNCDEVETSVRFGGKARSRNGYN